MIATLVTFRRFDPRLLMVAVLMACVYAIFLLDPQYASLQGKAGIDPDEALSTPMGFERQFPEPRADEKIKRIGWTAVQWAIVSKQPIGFGLLLGAGSLTLVPLLPRRQRTRFNLSVSRLDAIAWGMLLTLFPLFLAALKLAAAALMAWVVAPRLAAAPGPRSEDAWTPPDERPAGLYRAASWVAMRYARNLLTLVAVAIPLVVVCALVGAALVELLPWTRVAQIAQIEGWMPNAGIVLLVAVIGALLPVPFACGVILCALLWNAGVTTYVVATLLVTIGGTGLWSRGGSSFTWRVGSLAAAAVFALGLAAGATAGIVDQWHESSTIRQAASLLEQLPASKPASPILPAGRSGAELRGLAPALPAATRIVAKEGYELWHAPFVAASTRIGKTPFVRIEGSTLGLERLPLPRAYQTMQMGLMHLGGMAAGDINGDGWPDIAIATSFGVFLYVNIGGGFALQEIDFPPMREWIASVVALVDLDGDRALDLFFCTWMHGCHILFNRNGSFSAAAHVALPRFDETTVHAVAFADVDRDGWLDIVTGTTTSEPRFFYPAPAVNRLWRNRGGGRFEPEALAGPEGDTLSLLFADLNGDGWPDLFVGNDFDEPDRIYLNDRGTLRPVKAAASPIPRSTRTTMSVDTGDLDNDGRDELYIGQIAMGSVSEQVKRLKPPIASCDIYTDIAERSRCTAVARFQGAAIAGQNQNDIEACIELRDTAHRRDCIVMAHHWWRILVRLPALGADKAKVLAECAKIPRDFETLHDVCATVALSEIDNDESDIVYADEIPSIKHDNLLYAPDGKGFRDVTAQWGAAFGGWTWNAKFADLDNDTWQDLYVAQGSRLRRDSVSAIFYHNQEGRTFREETKSFGFEDHVPTGAYLYLDYDRDGDLDVITGPFQLTPVVMRNDSPRGPGFEIELDDRRSANRYGIGARVEIRAPDGRLQVRDIKASGGYQSFDPPLAFFGLGNWPAVASIKVVWPDGDVLLVPNMTLSPGRYGLVRLAR